MEQNTGPTKKKIPQKYSQLVFDKGGKAMQ